MQEETQQRLEEELASEQQPAGAQVGSRQKIDTHGCAVSTAESLAEPGL